MKSNKNIEIFKIKNNILNPALWNNGILKKEVLLKLKAIAKYFYDDLNIDNPIQDIYFTGSNAGYNWTDRSDIDLHIVLDFKNEDNINLIKLFFNIFKRYWNSKHNITLYGYPVEVYIEDINNPVKSSAIYSIQNNCWVKKPTKEKIKIDKDFIKKEYLKYATGIVTAIKDKNLESLENIIKNLYKNREKALKLKGEYSEYNIIFKLLRLKGYIQQLIDNIIKIKDSKFILK